MSNRVDVVAQAIWRAGYPRESDGRTWHDLVNKRHYRAMARAAIDALELTEERGVQIPGDPIRHLNPDQPFGDYSPSWGRFTRLVSPWVRKDNTDE